MRYYSDQQFNTGIEDNASYNIDSAEISDIIEVAKRIKKRIKMRKKILDDNG
jgi:hypothetical protein